LENAGRAFSRSRDEKSAARQVAELHEKEKKYQAKIGQLTLENAVSNTSLTVWCELPTLTAICR
jgi:hypothetical protein